MPKLTQKMVDIRERPKTGQVIVRDEELTGFAVRFTPKSAAYVVECRFNGANRRLTIGKTDRMSLEEARAKAREHLNKMASGIDPDAEKKIQKQATDNSERGSRCLPCDEAAQAQHHKLL